MGSEKNALLHLTQSQAINIACYKHHQLSHSISLDRATLIEDAKGCRLRVLGYKYVEFPLQDGMTRGAISACFHIEFGFNAVGSVNISFDTEHFSIFGENFRILNENGSGFIDGSDLEQVLISNSDYKSKYLPVSNDMLPFIAELEFETKLKNPTATMIKDWMQRRKQRGESY